MATTDIERLRYFQRQYLGARDFEDEQAYHRDMRRRHNVGPHTWGIVAGLELVEDVDENGNTSVYVLPGLAVDGHGREIVVLQPHKLDPATDLAGRSAGMRARDVYVGYSEESARDPAPGYATCDAVDQRSRILETYAIVVEPDSLDDGVTVSGKTFEPPAMTPEGPYDLGNMPFPTDGSYPQQELPEGQATWLVRIGAVNWDGAGGGSFQSPGAASADGRQYAALVGEALLAPGEQVRIRRRLSDPPVAAQDDTQFAAIEGTLRVDGLVTLREGSDGTGGAELHGGKISFRDPFGAEDPPLELYREEGEGLRVRLGDDADADKHTFSFGIKDESSFVPKVVIDGTGKVTTKNDLDVGGKVELNEKLSIRDSSGSDSPPVDLERNNGLRIVFSDETEGAHALTAGAEVGSAFQAKLTLYDDGKTAIVGDTIVGTGVSAHLYTRYIEGKKDDGTDDAGPLYINSEHGDDIVADGLLRISSIRGKATVSDADDVLYLNDSGGKDVVVGALLRVQKVRGKSSSDNADDTLYLNDLGGQDVWVGTSGTQAKLNVSGDLTVGAGSNGHLHTRHVDGKDYTSDATDDLYLQWDTDKNVHVGSTTHASQLLVPHMNARVGIGTGTPNVTLHVVGDVEIDGHLSVSSGLSPVDVTTGVFDLIMTSGGIGNYRGSGTKTFTLTSNLTSATTCHVLVSPQEYDHAFTSTGFILLVNSVTKTGAKTFDVEIEWDVGSQGHFKYVSYLAIFMP
jgi:hypothetical protein